MLEILLDAGSSNTITSSADNSTKTTVSQESAPAHERYETAAMQARVRELFTELRSGNTDAKKHVDETDDIVVVDASASLDEVEKGYIGEGFCEDLRMSMPAEMMAELHCVGFELGKI